MMPFPDFLARLSARHGPAAAEVRHELYFLAARHSSPLLQALTGILAALRDLALLTLVPGPRGRLAAGQVGLVATLPGPVGWDTLARALGPVRQAGRQPVAILHPRLGRRCPDGSVPALWLPRPPLRTVIRALGQGWRAARARSASPSLMSPVAIGAAVARHALWRAAWKRALAQGAGPLLLHNDFDMMGAASIGLGAASICIQHGVPAAEFFPVRADHQLIWGASSAAVFRAGGCPAERLAIDSLDRPGPVSLAGAAPPAGIVLISQTHAVVHGEALPGRLVDLARELAAGHPGLRVLLHPKEPPTAPLYRGIARLSIEAPPHRLLRPGSPCQLVVGFRSTALLDALLAGHYVLGLDWDEPEGPEPVASAPIRAATAREVLELHHRLGTDEAARRRFATALAEWRDRTFAGPTGALAELLAEALAESLAESLAR